MRGSNDANPKPHANAVIQLHHLVVHDFIEGDFLFLEAFTDGSLHLYIYCVLKLDAREHIVYHTFEDRDVLAH